MVITGTSREALNGRAGVATSFDHDRDRYVVELDGNAGEGEGEADAEAREPGPCGEETAEGQMTRLLDRGRY